VLTLPTDRPRPAVQRYRGAHATRLLPPPLAGALRSLAERRGASLFMALVAGFQALLYRWTAQPDLILGTAAANRDRVELEALIGLFVNTVALRGDLTGDPVVGELLDRARREVLATLAGRDVPFERLVDELQPERDLSHPAIVQVMLVLQNAPLTMPAVPGLELRAWEADHGTARFDLALSLLPRDGGLEAVFKYNRDLFDAATIGRLAGHFERLLTAAAAGPASRLSELPLLSAAERHQVAIEWNATAVAGWDGGCLHALFEAQAERTPAAVALVHEDRTLTYAQLDRRANHLAHRLRQLGVGPDVAVGVALERSFELLVGLLGVLKAGGAYLPLDPAYPLDHRRLMLADAAAPVVVTDARQAAEMAHGTTAVLVVDGPPAPDGPAPPVQPTSCSKATRATKLTWSRRRPTPTA